MVYVFNKLDKTTRSLPKLHDPHVRISAKTHEGITSLVEIIKAQVFSDYVTCTMEIPYDDGKTLSYLNDHAFIMNTEYAENTALIKLECSASDLKKFQHLVVEA